MLEKAKKGAFACGRCGKCVVHEGGYVCPAQYYTAGFDEMVARGRNTIVRSVIEGKLPLDQDIVDNTYTCFTCKACYVACGKPDPVTRKPIIDEPKIQQALREEIYHAGLQPAALKAVDDSIDATGNPFGTAPEKRSKWAEGLDLPAAGETVYFAGCYDSYRYPEVAQATVKVLRAGGIDVAYLGAEEWCCGVPELYDGNSELAEKLIIHNIEALKAAGVNKVITSCAGCYHALKSEYPEIAGELPFEVVHSSEVIAELLEEGKIKPETEVSCAVTYHDPCHLGRHENVYEAPRKILNAIPGVTLTEMPRHAQTAWCCGGGSVISNVNPELSDKVAVGRIQEAKETGAEVIISACPSCEALLGKAGRKDKIKVQDINVLMAKSLGL